MICKPPQPGSQHLLGPHLPAHKPLCCHLLRSQHKVVPMIQLAILLTHRHRHCRQVRQLCKDPDWTSSQTVIAGVSAASHLALLHPCLGCCDHLMNAWLRRQSGLNPFHSTAYVCELCCTIEHVRTALECMGSICLHYQESHTRRST